LSFFWCEAAVAVAAVAAVAAAAVAAVAVGKEKVGLDVSSPSHLHKSKNSLATRRKSRFLSKLTKIASAE